MTQARPLWAITCRVCGETVPFNPLMIPEALAAELHYIRQHPGLVPWACSYCRRRTPGTRRKPCSDISTGVLCPIYDPDPEAF